MLDSEINAKALAPKILLKRRAVYAEFGIYHGDTALATAKYMLPGSHIHCFDFEDTLETFRARLRADPLLLGRHKWHFHPNSKLLSDSYCWTLARMMKDDAIPAFDYCFIDGAHTWDVDALAFLLLDRMVSSGCYIEFDDWNWSIAGSHMYTAASNKAYYDARYTEEQRAAFQINMVMDLLVKPMARYNTIVPNRLFRKR